MDSRRRHLGSALTGVLSLLAVIVPVLVDQLRGRTAAVGVGTGWWWGAVLGFAVLFVVLALGPDSWPRVVDRTLLGALAVLGVVAFGLAPDLGFTSVLLVVTAVTATYVLSLRATAALVAAQVVAAGVLLWGTNDPVEAVLTALTFGAFQVFAVVTVAAGLREARARDEVARVNAELEAAQALLADSARTAERLRIARDLHDLVGHQLTALTLNLEVAAHHADGPARDHVERSRTAAKDLLRDVRDAVGRLRDPAADLGPALRAATDGIPRPAVHLRMPPGLAVPEPDRAHALVRSVQEVVTNAVRHSGADNLWIEVTAGADGTALRAWDDGRGAEAVRPGNGLTGMRERFEQLGGRVAFTSHPGAGFRVEGMLP